ncbi:MAG: hypothetical protein IPM48_04225 [Saprospiraceae bacterium]|nr:hypothetical protein [Saprospiraceae bacterium]
MSQFFPIHFLINPKAGKAWSKVEQKWLEEYCRLHRYSFYLTKSKADLIQICDQIMVSSQTQILVAVGGDGTVHDIATKIHSTHHILGIVPMGSGNGLAGHLGIPIGLEKSVLQLTKGKIHSMDLLEINHNICCNTSGFGLNGWVARKFGKKGGRGLFNYLRLGLVGFFRQTSFQVRFENQVYRKLLSFEIANSSQLGNGVNLSPSSNSSDGKSELVFLTTPSLWDVPWIIFAAFTKKLHQSKYICIVDATFGILEMNKLVDWHIDGEYMGQTDRLEFKVLPKALRIIS